MFAFRYYFVVWKLVTVLGLTRTVRNCKHWRRWECRPRSDVSTGKYLRATLLCNEVFSSRHLWTSAWCAEASDDSEPFDVGIVGQYSSCTAGSEMVWSDGMHFEAKSTDHLLILVNCCERLEAGCEKADRKEAARQRISASDVLCFDTCSERFWQHVMSHVMSSVYVHLRLYVFTCLHVYMFLHHITYHIIIKSNHIISYHIMHLVQIHRGLSCERYRHNPAPADASLTCCEACLVVDHQAGVQFPKAPPSLWQGMLNPLQNQRTLRSWSEAFVAFRWKTFLESCWISSLCEYLNHSKCWSSKKLMRIL